MLSSRVNRKANSSYNIITCFPTLFRRRWASGSCTALARLHFIWPTFWNCMNRHKKITKKIYVHVTTGKSYQLWEGCYAGCTLWSWWTADGYTWPFGRWFLHILQKKKIVTFQLFHWHYPHWHCPYFHLHEYHSRVYIWEVGGGGANKDDLILYSSRAKNLAMPTFINCVHHLLCRPFYEIYNTLRDLKLQSF